MISKTSVFYFTFLFCLISVVGQSQSFTARLDANEIIENSTVNVVFSLDGAKGNRFTPPDFSPLEVVGGPARSSQMQIVNGAVSQSESYTYTLLATKKGKYTIGSATIEINGNKLRTKPITVNVIKGKGMASLSEKDKKTFVRIEASDTTAILGQQITLMYKLYTQQDVNGYDLLNESDYEGFFSQPLRNFNAAVKRKIIDGDEYHTKDIKKVALFPQRTGAFTIDPVVINLSIPIPGAKRRGFFGQVPSRNKRISTNELTLQVNDPPSGAPISFSGAVGKYGMISKINKTSITTDDAFVINMEVRGTGDGKTFTAPDQPKLDNMEYYDPNVVRDEDTSGDGVVSNYKKIEYLIVPKKPGIYLIRPEFTYYDTDSNDYITLAPKTFKVKVTQGTRKVTTDDRDVSVSGKLVPSRQKVNMISPFFLRFGDSFLWGGFLLGFLGLGMIGFKKWKILKEENLDPEEKRRRKATALAISKLEKAKGYMDANEDRKFYEEISITMNGYLGNKYGLPNTEFNKDSIAQRLQSSGVDSSDIETYLSILKTCEMAIFAGQPPKKKEETYNKSKNLILTLEK